MTDLHDSRSARWKQVAGLLVLLAVATLAFRWWADGRQDALGDRVAARAAPGDIQMVSSQTCVYCALARRWFDEHRVAYRECMIEKDAGCREVFERSRAPGTPLILVKGKALVGFDPKKIDAALQG